MNAESDTYVETANNFFPKFSKWALWIFAAVGFMASTVTIAQFFQSASGELKVQIAARPTQIPSTVSKAFGSEDKPGYVLTIAKSNMEFFCQNLDDPKKTLTQLQISDIKSECGDYKALSAVGNLVEAYNDRSYSFVDYNIQNSGTKSATGIRISSSNIITAEIVKENGDVVNIEKSKNDTYAIPDLNPEEKIRVSIFLSSPLEYLDSQYSDYTDYPKITYNGKSTSISINKMAPAIYAEIYYFLSDMYTIFAVFFVIAISFLIVVIVILPVAILDGLIKGKTFKQIFATPEETTKIEGITLTGATTS